MKAATGEKRKDHTAYTIRDVDALKKLAAVDSGGYYHTSTGINPGMWSGSVLSSTTTPANYSNFNMALNTANQSIGGGLGKP